MLLEVLQSTLKQHTKFAQLPECVGFFTSKALAKVEIGKSYDFIIIGYSNKVIEKTGLPAAVFLDVAEPTDLLVRETTLERAGCEETLGKNSGSISTYSLDVGEIYAGRNTPAPIVDNYDLGELPDYPTPEVEMWVRKINHIYYAIGVNSYADMAPCFSRRPEIARVTDFRRQVIELRERYSKLQQSHIDGVSLTQAKKELRQQFGLVLVPLRGFQFPTYKTV